MRFIKFNFNSGEVFAFALDSLVEFKNGELPFTTFIGLINGTGQILPIDIDELCATVFSDIADEREYELIEIDENDEGSESLGETSPETDPPPNDIQRLIDDL